MFQLILPRHNYQKNSETMLQISHWELWKQKLYLRWLSGLNYTWETVEYHLWLLWIQQNQALLPTSLIIFCGTEILLFEWRLLFFPKQILILLKVNVQSKPYTAPTDPDNHMTRLCTDRSICGHDCQLNFVSWQRIGKNSASILKCRLLINFNFLLAL